MFGGCKKGAAAVSPEEAILKLKEVEKMLNKKTDFLEKKIDQELKVARENAKKNNRRAALQALKRKTRFEQQLGLIDGQLTNLEFQQNALDSALTNKRVLEAMDIAAKALKTTHETMNVDYAQHVMDGMIEEIEVANDISDIISSPTGFDKDIDDDELEAELNELLQETIPILPSVPTEDHVAPRTEKAKAEKDAMKELAQWAS